MLRATCLVSALATLTVIAVGIPPSSVDAASLFTNRSYLPLEEGNTWTYVNTDGPVPVTCTCRVVKAYKSSGEIVYVLSDFFVGLSYDPVHFCEMNRDLFAVIGSEVSMFYPWSDPEGSVVVPEGFDVCMIGAVGHFEPADPLILPAGHFKDAITIRYTELPCADAGPSSETFVAGVGLVQRKVLTIAGIRTWSLQYAEVGGRIYGHIPHETASGAQGRSLPFEERTWGSIKAQYR